MPKIINLSLSTSSFPLLFRHSIVTPLLKKLPLDKEFLSNYRSVSKLSFISKLTEHIFRPVSMTTYLLSHSSTHASLILPSGTQPKPFSLPCTIVNAYLMMLKTIENNLRIMHDKLSMTLLLPQVEGIKQIPKRTLKKYLGH